ncbi:MAG: repeat protein [Bacteroidetes bacterium]|nr:repeat protein [Bacteroidota bacterium]
MKTEIITHQILSLVKSYCKPSVVTGLMNDLRRSEALEHRMIRGEGGGQARQQDQGISLGDQEKLDRLITLCHSRLSVDDVCQVLLGIGDIFKVQGETNRAEEIYTMALSKGEESGKREFVAEAYMRRGEIYSRKAQWKQSTSDLGHSRVILSELKHHEALGRVENILGTNYAEQGKTKRAVQSFERALTLFERTRQTQLAGIALMNLGIVCNIVGDCDSALAHYKRAQSCFEGVGDVNRLAELHHNIGMSYLSKRLYNDAIREFYTSFTLSSRILNVSVMGLSNLGKANAYYHQKDFPMSLMLVSQAIELFTKSTDRLGLADAYKVKGMIHREMKRFDSAESYLYSSLRINLELNNRLNVAEAYYEIGMLELKRKKKQKAVAAFQKARAGFRKVGAREEEKRTQSMVNSIGGRR